MKIVINSEHGGFGLSDKAIALYESLVDNYGSRSSSIRRECPHLVSVVETLGCKEASAAYASLKIVEVPDDVDWTIKEYDGNEWVAEVHRTWN